MEEDLMNLLGVFVSDARPPDSPVMDESWAALAFDRNLYEDLAPSDVWEAWLATHRELTDPDCRVWIMSVAQLSSGGSPLGVVPIMDSLREYWLKDANFLSDHYVFSVSSRSLVRLDQDVTLFAATSAFVSTCVDGLGGLDLMMSRMNDDFGSGDDDAEGLRAFLRENTKALNARDAGGASCVP